MNAEEIAQNLTYITQKYSQISVHNDNGDDYISNIKSKIISTLDLFTDADINNLRDSFLILGEHLLSKFCFIVSGDNLLANKAPFLTAIIMYARNIEEDEARLALNKLKTIDKYNIGIEISNQSEAYFDHLLNKDIIAKEDIPKSMDSFFICTNINKIKGSNLNNVNAAINLFNDIIKEYESDDKLNLLDQAHIATCLAIAANL